MVSSKLAAAAARKFPDPAELERRNRILTVIEAITDNGGYRHYIYSKTYEKTAFRFASYDSGSGDNAKIFFGDDLTFVRAFDHEAHTNPWLTGEIWPGVLDNIPLRCRRFVEHDAPKITSALWHAGAGWEHGSPVSLPSGQEPEPTFWMFDPVVDNFSAQALAESFSVHTDSNISPQALQPFLHEIPLTEKNIHLVNPEASTGYVKQVAETAGYPSQL